MQFTRVVVGACLGLALVAAGRSDADPVVVRSGKVVLPISGLAIELPKDARKRATWSLSGSWALNGGEGESFDGRDVIDQKIGNRIIRGNWVHAGYFDAGDCAAVVKDADLSDRWFGEADLYGAHFQVGGGIFEFDVELGKVPALALCTESGADGKALLLYHFFVAPGGPSGPAGLAAIRKDKLLAEVTRAWKTGSYGEARPTQRPEIRQRGEIAPVRRVRLGRAGIELDVPDDGFVWLAPKTSDVATTEFLERMAPALPEITLEVARFPGETCGAIHEALKGGPTFEEPAPLGVPVPWTALTTVVVEKHLERVVCRETGGHALVVGLIGEPVHAAASRDFAPFALIMQALVDAGPR